MHPAAHRLDVADEPVALGGRHTIGAIMATYSRPRSQVAGDRPGLEQGLELPGLRPALVVAAVAGEGADQRARPCPRAAGWRRPARSCPRRCGPSRPASSSTRAGWRPAWPPCSSTRPSDRLGDEDDVDVADVVELVAAALAHRDHRQPAAGAASPDLGPGDGQRGVEGAGGQVGQLGGDVVDADVVGQVAARRAGAAAGGTPPAARPPPRGPAGRDRVGSPGSAPTARAARRERRTPAGGSSRASGRSARASARVPAQVVAERGAGAEDAEQPHRGALVVDELVQQSPGRRRLDERHSPASAWSGSAASRAAGRAVLRPPPDRAAPRRRGLRR